MLNRTREYLTSLNAEIEKLSKKNKQLEAQLQQLPAEEVAEEEGSESSNERLELRVTQVSETTSEEQRIIDLQVVIRGESPVQEMLIRILEFLNQVNNVNVIFIVASTRTTESRSANRVRLRLKIEVCVNIHIRSIKAYLSLIVQFLDNMLTSPRMLG